MHGRVKVRTSEEEKVKKERERQEKLKIFKHAMQKIQFKRSNSEFDQEMLELTGKVLASNPDIYTLWNIRRETIEVVRKIYQSEELSQLYNSELHLTEYCLKINPKSYCTWHQREWILITRDDPDWKKELDICDKYLKLDERNFHTWDYRKFIVSQCKPSLETEFKFTTEKIHDNFSNYSAWHYRSKLLVELYPDREGGRPIKDQQHKYELKLVLDAAFTDPDDTSAWFYQRWLLGAVKITTQLIVCAVSSSKTTVAFNSFVPKGLVESRVKLVINGESISGEWESCTEGVYDNLWILKHNVLISEDSDIQAQYEMDDGNKQMIRCIKQKSLLYVGKNDISFQKVYSQQVIEELNAQLVSCRMLTEMEPDNKWTLLTTTVLLYCIDAKAHHKEVMSNLHTLKKIDPSRSGYYEDLIAKWSMEQQLLIDYNRNDAVTELTLKFTDTLTILPHLQYYSYCQVVDLSNLKLTSKVLPSFAILQHCKSLSLENNMLTSLKGFPKIDLEVLNLKGNLELCVQDVELLKNNTNCDIIF